MYDIKTFLLTIGRFYYETNGVFIFTRLFSTLDARNDGAER